MHSRTLLLICLVYCGMTQAEYIYRCADQNGKVSYTATPCVAGSSNVKTFEVNSPPPPPVTPFNMGRPTTPKEEARAFQRRHEERLKQEQEEEHAKARRQRDEDAYRQQREAFETAEKERQGPTSRFEKNVKEKTYIKP